MKNSNLLKEEKKSHSAVVEAFLQKSCWDLEMLFRNRSVLELSEERNDSNIQPRAWQPGLCSCPTFLCHSP